LRLRGDECRFFGWSIHNSKMANKWMLATAGAALLVYSESSARRARSLSFGISNHTIEY